MWFQPRHVVALAAIAATAFVLQPVASQAVGGSLVTIVDGATNNTAAVNSAGELLVRPGGVLLGVHVASAIAPGNTVDTTTAACRVTQVYAYPFPVGKLPAVPDATTLTTAVFLPAAAVGRPARTLAIASWDSGTPAGPGVVHALTRTAVQQTIRFHVSKGTYSWQVWLYCMR
jgi:hypothetical protein